MNRLAVMIDDGLVEGVYLDLSTEAVDEWLETVNKVEVSQ